jgi:hypothetical protein
MGVSFFCAIKWVSRQKGVVTTIPALHLSCFWLIFKTGRIFMFREKEIIELLTSIDKKLGNILSIMKSQILKNQSKGDK